MRADQVIIYFLTQIIHAHITSSAIIIFSIFVHYYKFLLLISGYQQIVAIDIPSVQSSYSLLIILHVFVVVIHADQNETKTMQKSRLQLYTRVEDYIFFLLRFFSVLFIFCFGIEHKPAWGNYKKTTLAINFLIISIPNETTEIAKIYQCSVHHLTKY